jgi:hypothetical protein
MRRSISFLREDGNMARPAQAFSRLMGYTDAMMAALFRRIGKCRNLPGMRWA